MGMKDAFTLLFRSFPVVDGKHFTEKPANNKCRWNNRAFYCK